MAIAAVGVRLIRTRRRQLPEHVWTVDEEMAAAIGDPLARIAARHSPVSGGKANDLGDALEVVGAVGAYAIVNLNEERTYGVPIPVAEPQPDAAGA